ncbi:hypothetical protein LI177_13190 [bacterium 210820-DFI.6.37]|nr:hypothetical protein [bacterium 210820-DFI.6.37]
MKEHRTKEQRRITALITAVFMLLALLVPAVSAAPVSAAADVTITKIQLVTPPEDPSVAIRNGKYSYNLYGAKLKVTYSNGNSETLYADSDGFDSVYLYLLPDDLEVEFYVDMTDAKEGIFDAEILCKQWDGEKNPLAEVKTTVALEGTLAKSIQSISVQSLPEELTAYAGTNVVLCEGLKVKAVYTDGTSEVITYEYGSFDTPKYDPTAKIRLKEKTIAQGKNTVEIQYGINEFDESEEEYIFKSECVTSFQVTGQKIKLPTGIEIAGTPEQENAYIGKNGWAHYSANGLKVKISYDDGSSEIVETERDDNGDFEDAYLSPAYQPKGLECSVGIEEKNLVIGKNTLDVVYRMYFNSTVVKKYKAELSVMGVAAKTVKNISVVKGPDKQDLLVGLDDEAIYKGVTVKLEYTDGTSDLVICGGTSYFDLPEVLGGGNYMYIEEMELKEGQNTITVVYEDADDNQKKTNFQVTASTYIAKDETLDTDQKTGSSIGELGQVILNENHELWINHADYPKVAYEKKTGIKKAYNRVYIETSGTGVILDSDGKVAGSYPNALDCSDSELLLKNGDLYFTWSNKKIASDIKTWGGGVALKNDGRVQVLYADKETYLSDAADIVDIQYGYMLDTDGNVFDLVYDWDDATDEEIYSVEKVAVNVDKIIGYSNYIGKDGKTYCFDSDWSYWNESKVVFDQEAVAYKYFYEESYDEENDDYDYRSYVLFVDPSRNIYLYDIEDGTTTRLTGEYEAFTDSGYKTTSGKFYDNKGQTTTILKETEKFSLDTNNVLYMKGTKLLDHVTDFYSYSEPVVITREDGTTWLFDIYDTEDRLRLSPPQKLTEELMASLKVSVSKLTISVPAQTYTGKALTPAVTVKDGSKTLKNGTDYTVTYSNNVNAGTGKVTITGKGNYTGSVTKTFAIAKAKQTITGTSTFNKAYGSKAFSLGAKAKGKLTYKSSNTKVATVSSAGKVTIKGTGTATITVNAAATTNYNKAAAKKVTIKVAPKKMAAPTVKAAKKKMTVSWKKDTKATGYQLTYALNSKFTKSKKSVTISKNKTTKKTISKLKSKKTYYVKMRAYKTVGKTKLYGSYSKVKKIKVK